MKLRGIPGMRVRTGRFKKLPGQWEMNGYNEIHNPPTRYGVIYMAGLGIS
jgi:hypothetical protein